MITKHSIKIAVLAWVASVAVSVVSPWPGDAGGAEPSGRGSRSLSVSVPPDMAAAAGPAMQAWNAAAGWQVLVPARADDTKPDVTIRAGKRSQAMYATGTQPCRIEVKNAVEIVITHELGHCLGLSDHLWPECEDDEYRGIMSYCSTHWGVSVDDVAALEGVGYAVVHPSVCIYEPSLATHPGYVAWWLNCEGYGRMVVVAVVERG